MRFKLTPEVHLILIKDTKIFMLRRFQTGYMDGFFSLVAGHVDGGESFRAAMTREASEEAGISIEPQDLEHAHTMHRLENGERVSMFFTAKRLQGEPHNAEPDKCDATGWFATDALPEQTVPYVRHAIALVLKKQPYSEFGW